MISIIIVSHNSEKDLENCLNSIFKSSFTKFKVILVDNDSTDSSVEIVKKKFPEVLILKNKNTGYAGGNNLGIKKAIALGSDYIFILNPDTILDKNCLGVLAERAEESTILQPMVLLANNGKKSELINTTDTYLNFLGFGYCNNYKKHQDSIPEKEIGLGSGAAVFMGVNVFKKIGFFDENFFMYHEDVDLFYRARLNGFSIRLLPKARVYHNYSFSKNNKKFFYAERNRLLFLYKNFSLKYLILIFPMFLVNEILITLYSIIGGWFIYKIKSSISAISLLKDERKIRKSNLPKIKQFEHKNKKYIGSELSFSEVTNPLLIPYNVLLAVYFKIIYLLI